MRCGPVLVKWDQATKKRSLILHRKNKAAPRRTFCTGRVVRCVSVHVTRTLRRLFRTRSVARDVAFYQLEQAATQCSSDLRRDAVQCSAHVNWA